eukprot:3721329-Amphidinium_carterae.2
MVQTCILCCVKIPQRSLCVHASLNSQIGEQPRQITRATEQMSLQWHSAGKINGKCQRIL